MRWQRLLLGPLDESPREGCGQGFLLLLPAPSADLDQDSHKHFESDAKLHDPSVDRQSHRNYPDVSKAVSVL